MTRPGDTPSGAPGCSRAIARSSRSNGVRGQRLLQARPAAIAAGIRTVLAVTGASNGRLKGKAPKLQPSALAIDPNGDLWASKVAVWWR